MIAPPASPPVSVVLSAFVAGRTRADILAAHPELRSEDIDAALTAAKADILADRLPDIVLDGVRLTTEQISDLKAPPEVSERLEDLVTRTKYGDGLTRDELAEMKDAFRFDHVMLLAKAKAKLLLMRAAG